MVGRRRRKRILHVNMLRKWHAVSATSFMMEEIEDEQEDVVSWDEGAESDTPTFSSGLSHDQIAELQRLLADFDSVLCNEPGKTDIAEHRIDVEPNTRPIKLPPYRVPHTYHQSLREELEQMEQMGIIERSSSDWAAPIVLVKKKDSSIRLCTDYRRLNAVSRADAYPMPRIDDLVDRLGKAKFITTLDLSRGYWQVPISRESQPKTAFASPFGLFEFRRMPFGLHGAPATFQRMMDRLLWDVGDYAAAYLDDVVIHSTTWEEHLEHVRNILQKLREAGLTVKPTKCQFARSRCAYLGHIVGGGEIRPDERKIQCVKGFATPTHKRQVRAFLGLTGYYRKFIPNYATLAAPLTDLTRKACPNRVAWDDKCETAFNALKTQLCSSPILRSPDFERPFILQTDASERAVGAVLSQVDDVGEEHPNAFFSRKLLPREERYSTVEKECLAIKLALQAFRVYLLGRQFTVQTDHRSLEWLHRFRDTNARLTRWSLALQPYKFTVKHRAGTANGNADALSRLHHPTSVDATKMSQEKEGGV